MADFFELQDKAKRHTSLLVFYFFMAFLCIIILLNLAIWFAGNLTGQFEIPLQQWPLHQYSWFSTLAIVLLIGGVSLIRIIQLGNGGHAVAKMMNGRRIKFDTTNTQERQLLNVVEEMSIASGMPIPAVYIMDNESGINAFVAGLKPSQTVMVVTKGALDTFSRDELQGVVAHEFSHIFNADMRINVKLIGILAGILAVGQLGGFFLRLTTYSHHGRHSRSFSRSSGSKGKGGQFVFVIMILGASLFVIGYVGLFFARLIKAGISRQREFLADASSVQFTRNKDGIVDALLQIKKNTVHGLLSNAHAEETSHMCFEQPVKISLSGWLATHPPLDERIRALKPSYRPSKASSSVDSQSVTELIQGKEQAVGFSAGGGSQGNRVQTEQNAGRFKPAVNKTNGAIEVTRVESTSAYQTADLHAKELINSIGHPTAESVQSASNTIKQIPAGIWQQSQSSIRSAQLMIFALLIHAEPEFWPQLKNSLRAKFSNEEMDKLESWVAQLLPLKGYIRLALLNHVIPILQPVAEKDSKMFWDEVMFIIKFNKQIHISEYIIYALLKLRLNTPSRSAEIKQLKKVKQDIAYLLSAMLYASQQDVVSTNLHYQNIMNRFALGDIPKTDTNSFDAPKVHNALLRLSRLQPMLKRSVIEALADAVIMDGKIDVNEYELLRTVCDYLDCPMPPLVVG